MWDTLEIIFGASPSIKQERMKNKPRECEIPDECESHSHRWYSTNGTIGGIISVFLTSI